MPQWVKRDPQHFPRMINSAGTPLDVLSANAPTNMEADRKAFSALMHHIAEKDGSEHTVLMMQVENESGGIGSARDFSPASNREFAGQVPPELLKALGRKAGTWTEVFPGNADEAFQAWHVARYVNAVAEAGKREFNIPFYCNVWLAYPPGELPERHIAIAGIGYPSGGPTQGMLPIWKAAAPAIDAIGPDLYSSNPEFALDILDTYARPDNPLWIPETGRGDDFAAYLFAALDRGAIGFSPFGIDWTDHPPAGTVPRAHAVNFALLGPMDRTLAQLTYTGNQRDGQPAPGSVNKEGRVLVAQLGYLLTGIGGAVFFHRPGFLPGIRMQILTAEEGYYTPGSSPGAPEIWHATRVLNGDETDRGIRFPDPSASSTNRDANTSVSGDSAAVGTGRSGPKAVRITLGRF